MERTGSQELCLYTTCGPFKMPQAHVGIQEKATCGWTWSTQWRRTATERRHREGCSLAGQQTRSTSAPASRPSHRAASHPQGRRRADSPPLARHRREANGRAANAVASTKGREASPLSVQTWLRRQVPPNSKSQRLSAEIAWRPERVVSHLVWRGKHATATEPRSDLCTRGPRRHTGLLPQLLAGAPSQGQRRSPQAPSRPATTRLQRAPAALRRVPKLEQWSSPGLDLQQDPAMECRTPRQPKPRVLNSGVPSCKAPGHAAPAMSANARPAGLTEKVRRVPNHVLQ